jgi:hypothetical protein
MRRYYKEVKEMTFLEFVKYLFGENYDWSHLLAAKKIWLEDGGDPKKIIFPSEIKFPEGIDENTEW